MFLVLRLLACPPPECFPSFLAIFWLPKGTWPWATTWYSRRRRRAARRLETWLASKSDCCCSGTWLAATHIPHRSQSRNLLWHLLCSLLLWRYSSSGRSPRFRMPATLPSPIWFIRGSWTGHSACRAGFIDPHLALSWIEFIWKERRTEGIEGSKYTDGWRGWLRFLTAIFPEL